MSKIDTRFGRFHHYCATDLRNPACWCGKLKSVTDGTNHRVLSSNEREIGVPERAWHRVGAGRGVWELPVRTIYTLQLVTGIFVSYPVGSCLNAIAPI